jgi:hypothetical protein
LKKRGRVNKKWESPSLMLNYSPNPPLSRIDLEQSEISIYRERTPFSRKKKGEWWENLGKPLFLKEGFGVI